MASAVFLSVLWTLRSEFSDHRFERQIKTFAAVKWVGESRAFDRDLLSDPSILVHYQKRILSRACVAAGQAFALAILLLLPVFMAAGLLLSHRMVGGMVRIEEHLKRVLRGESHETLVCRKGDEIQPIVETLSAIDRNYIRRMKHIKECAEKIRQNLQLIEKEVGQDARLQIILKQQENALREIGKILKSGGI